MPPTPPEPGPVPEPVDPDNPGGAQTGDMIPVDIITLFAIFSAIVCIVCSKRDYILGRYEL